MKERTATLWPKHLSHLMNSVLGSIPTSRPVESRIKAAEAKLSKILKTKFNFETGEVEWNETLLEGPVTETYNEKELFGFKVGLVQEIKGSQVRPGVNYMTKKTMVVPIAKALGILKQIERETEGSEGGDFSIDFDEEVGEDNLEDGQQVDLDGEDAAVEPKSGDNGVPKRQESTPAQRT